MKLNRYAFFSTTACAALALALLVSPGCDGLNEGGTLIEQTTTAAPSFTLVHVSGHMGSYSDCQEKSVNQGNAEQSSRKAAPAFSGDCADGDDCGPAYLNCEHAEATVEITNTGKEALVGLSITNIDIHYGSNVFTSEVLDLTRTDGQALDAPIPPGTSVQLVIQFRGVDGHAFDGIGTDFTAQQILKVDFTSGKTTNTYESSNLKAVPQIAT